MRAHLRRGLALAAVVLTVPGLVGPGVVSSGVAELLLVAADTKTCQGQPATIVGTLGDDVIEGTKGDDVIVALAGDDLVQGRGGDDLICGGYGSDRLLGGPGADRLYGGFDRFAADESGTYLVGDVLDGGEGDDQLVGVRDDRKVDRRRRPDTISYADATQGVVVVLGTVPGTATGQGTDTISVNGPLGVEGSAFADTITGSDADDWIQGGDGSDLLVGGAGSDTIYAERVDGSGRDVLRGGAGWDLLGSYAGRDELHGGYGDDFVEAYSPKPTVVTGDVGNDYVAQHITRRAGAGSSGGEGRDVLVLYGQRLEGSTPRTVFSVDLRSGTTTADLRRPPDGTVDGFEEYRLVGHLAWRFHGTTGPDRVWAITGGPLRAWLFGGNDWATGTDRNDLVNGGPGIDEVHARGGDDRCVKVERGGC